MNAADPRSQPWTTRVRRWTEPAVWVVVGLGLLAAAGLDLTLHFGPTRAAECHGKRIVYAVLRTDWKYRVSYTYDDGGRRAADTDRVNFGYFQRASWGSPLRVRTFGFGTFRFARLADASDPHDDWTAAVRWGGLATVGGI